VDDDRRTPERTAQTWLWFTYGSELLNADLRGRYQLEPVAGSGPPWAYVWRLDENDDVGAFTAMSD
jgi:hypothetical protein